MRFIRQTKIYYFQARLLKCFNFMCSTYYHELSLEIWVSALKLWFVSISHVPHMQL